jgi:hypothetical protein
MDALITKAMEFDQVDFNDLEEGKEYLLAIGDGGGDLDNSFGIVQCLRVFKAGDEVYHTTFNGDFYDIDEEVIYSGGVSINPDERIKIYNWPPAIDGTGAQNTLYHGNGGTGGTSRKRRSRKSRKTQSRKRCYK